MTSAWDLARNVILFVPFGVLGFVLAGRGRSTAAGVAAVVVGAALVSASFEALQFFIEFRTSSFLDVITNTLGAFVGAVGCRILWPGRFSALRVQ